MRVAIVLLVCGVLACNEDVDGEQTGTVASAVSVVLSSAYNKPDDHFEQEIGLPRGNFGIYDRAGNRLAVVNSKQSTGWIQGNERVESKVGSLYWLWGHKSGLKVSGFVRGEVISKERGVRVRGEHGAANQNGRSTPVARTALRVKVTPLPGEFRHATTKNWSANKPGDVNAVDQYAVTPVSSQHAYLTWSVPWDGDAKTPLKGGGIVRSIVKNGDAFYPAAAVQPIEMPAFSDDKARIGTVTWIYGCAEQDGKRVFGWMVKSHQETGSAAVDHLEAS